MGDMGKFVDKLRRLRRRYCSVVVVAAGASERMGRDKLFLPIGGTPVLALNLLSLERCEAVKEIVVVTRQEKIQAVGALRGEYGISKMSKIVVGGENRTISAHNGVQSVSARADIICVHDGARPFASSEVIEAVLHRAVLDQAAVPALPLRDTVKEAEDGVVTKTLDRSKLYAIQTPQAFRAEILKGALTKAVREKKSYTDDSAAVEAMGVPVHLTQGDADNIKITTPADLVRAEEILKRLRGNTEGTQGA